MMIAVLGAGLGGLAATIELTRAGYDVRLWNRNPERLEVHEAEGIHYCGVWGEGVIRPAELTSDLSHAIDGVDAVVVCLPSVVHSQLFHDLAMLACSTPVLLNPGHTGGALHLRNVFTQARVPLPPIAEFSTLTYVGRVNKGIANITGRAGSVSVGALPGGQTALDVALTIFPGVNAVADVLASSLSNINLVLHPPGAILSAAWVEATSGDFTFYVDALTPAVARVLECFDSERLAVAHAFGHTLPNLLDEMSAVGTVDTDAARRGDTVAAIRGGVVNSTIPAPDSFNHRYYQEDFAFGVLPFVALAYVADVDVPIAKSLLTLGNSLVGGRLIDSGLDAGKLGISGLTRDALIASVRA